MLSYLATIVTVGAVALGALLFALGVVEFFLVIREHLHGRIQ